MSDRIRSGLVLVCVALLVMPLAPAAGAPARDTVVVGLAQ